MDLRSVALAADRMGRTPSAVSHALARLREQVGDPLLVKVAGRMQPSPFALQLIEDVRPILRSIQRVITPPQPFDPATSTRIFRVAIPAIGPLMAAIFARISREAPHVGLEWTHPSADAYPAVADGQIDLAHLGGEVRLPDGLDSQTMLPWTWTTFARKDHPALARWNMQAWLTWPHVMVHMANTARNPVQDRMAELGQTRRIGALVAEFASLAPLLARTNLIATFPAIVFLHDTETYGLRLLRPPIDLPPFVVRFFWSARLSSDPGTRWIRKVVLEEYDTAQTRANAMLAAHGLAGGSS